MRYLGGKTQIATELAAVVNLFRQDRPFLDPFCGSLAVAKALGGPGICSDIHPALIALYPAIQDGWVPPSTLSKDEWEDCKRLPAINPLHGFAGFGCSFRGLYFQSYGGGYVGPVSNFGAIAAKTVLLRDIDLLSKRGVVFQCQSFFDIPPSADVFLYLDPPYRGTTAYRGTPDFDYDRFYARVKEWAVFGPVCVSEYAFPLGECVWEKSRARKLITGSGLRAVERLFVVE